MKYAVALCALCLASPALGQSACEGSGTLSSLTECAEAAVELADDELNLIWNEIKSRADAAGWGQDLLDAQRIWLSYRDTTCEIERVHYNGGSSAPLIHLLCLERLTLARSADLLALF